MATHTQSITLEAATDLVDTVIKHVHSFANTEGVNFAGVSGQIQKLTDKIFTLEQTASYATTPADAKRHANLVALFAKSLADNPTLDALTALTKAKDVSKRKLSALFNTAFTAKLEAWSQIIRYLEAGVTIKAITGGLDVLQVSAYENWVRQRSEQATHFLKASYGTMERKLKIQNRCQQHASSFFFVKLDIQCSVLISDFTT